MAFDQIPDEVFLYMVVFLRGDERSIGRLRLMCRRMRDAIDAETRLAPVELVVYESNGDFEKLDVYLQSSRRVQSLWKCTVYNQYFSYLCMVLRQPSMPKITHLTARRGWAPDWNQNMSWICHLGHIQTLDVSHSAIDRKNPRGYDPRRVDWENIFDRLCLPKLRHLDVSHCSWLTPEFARTHLDPIHKGRRIRLETINIVGCHLIEWHGVAKCFGRKTRRPLITCDLESIGSLFGAVMIDAADGLELVETNAEKETAVVRFVD